MDLSQQAGCDRGFRPLRPAADRQRLARHSPGRRAAAFCPSAAHLCRDKTARLYAASVSLKEKSISDLPGLAGLFVLFVGCKNYRHKANIFGIFAR